MWSGRQLQFDCKNLSPPQTAFIIYFFQPTHEQLCQAVFEEDELHEILPTITGDVMDLKEKRKFRKVFKETAVQLCKRINALTEYSYEPASRLRAVNKLAPLGCK